VVCSIFHAERSNITCVSPGFAVSCDIPSFHPDSPIADVDENDVVPSSSFYNDQVTSVSCIARGMGEQDIRRLANFSDSLHPLCTISPPPDFSLFRRLPFLYRQFSLSTLRKIMRVIKKHEGERGPKGNGAAVCVGLPAEDGARNQRTCEPNGQILELQWEIVHTSPVGARLRHGSDPLALG
jgi:hypothetical protein